MSKPISSPLKYFGGKHYLAARIRQLFPPHTRYVEPYFGGGSVLLAGTGEGVTEFVNDVDGELMTFWSVLQNPTLFKEFKRAINLCPFSQELWIKARDRKLTVSKNKDVNLALAYFLQYRLSRQGLGRDLATPTSRLRRGINENVSAYLSAVDGLPDVAARLLTVEIYSTSAPKLIQRLDSADTLFYLDPPYLHSTRIKACKAYRFEMTEKHHRDLLQLLSGIKGKFLLSGYPSKLYSTYASLYGWYRTRFLIDNKASSKKEKQIKEECVWTNFKLEKQDG